MKVKKQERNMKLIEVLRLIAENHVVSTYHAGAPGSTEVFTFETAPFIGALVVVNSSSPLGLGKRPTMTWTAPIKVTPYMFDMEDLSNKITVEVNPKFQP